VAGLALAAAAVRVLVALGPATLPRLGEIRIDGVAFGFAAALSLLAGVSFGAIPMWRGSPGQTSLRESGRSNTVDRSRYRARHALMGAQVALALVLVVASALMVRSFLNLRAFDPGFDASSALTFRVGLPQSGYPTRDAAVSAHDRILDELAAIPGVRAVSASTGLPLSPACFGNSILVQGRPADPERRSPAVAMLCAVTHDYVEAMGVRILRGRALTRDDVERRQPNVLVNRAFVDRFFPQDEPVGKRVRSNAPPTAAARRDLDGTLTWDGAPPWLEIVGVVSNTPLRALAEPNPMPVVYMPMSIAGGPDIPMIAMLGPDVSAMSYVIRTTSSPALLPAIRRAVDAVDPGLAIAQVQELRDIVDQGSAQMAFTMVLMTIAAGAALLLGVVGIYGVVSYIVAQRIGEIGVRLALGAEPRGVVRMVVRKGLTVALVGAAAGVSAALASGRFVESLLYNVSPRDPLIFVGTTLTLLAVALLACWLPARRAASVSPIEALRAE
jgi:predicted permease